MRLGSAKTHLAKRSTRDSDVVRTETANGPIVSASMRGDLSPFEFYEAFSSKLGLDTTYDEFIEIWNCLLEPNEAIDPLILPSCTKRATTLRWHPTPTESILPKQWTALKQFPSLNGISYPARWACSSQTPNSSQQCSRTWESLLRTVCSSTTPNPMSRPPKN